MRVVVCLAFVVACVQAVSLESSDQTQTGLGSAFSYLNSFFGGISSEENKNYWPYVEYETTNPRQSPIDLITSLAVTRSLPTLEIVEPDLTNHSVEFYNSGHTVYIYMSDDAPENRPQLRGGPLLNNTFYFEQMHFHWGDEDVWGSEHFIDGQSSSAEIHMVHWNSKYDNFTYAATQDDGLAVLTVFVEENNSTDNTLLEPLYNLMANVSTATSYVYLDGCDAMKWAISSLTDNTEYYTYPGSLTTSPYTENVIFILLPKPISLSNTQLEAFRTIHGTEEDECITDNKRKLQPLHSRPIVRATNLQEL